MPEEIICVEHLRELKAHGIHSAVLAIGVFDGVHSGHRKLLESLHGMADRLQAEPVVMTFWPHPKLVLDPEHAPLWLVSLERKKELMRRAGIRAMIAVPFTREFAALPPEEFIRQCIGEGGVHVHGICVGANWRFGAGGRGDVELLGRLSVEMKFQLCPVHELKIDNVTVSSSAVRAALTRGDIRLVTTLLGRYYTIYGKVEHGFGVATGTLACPTANLKLDSGLFPKHGVYAGFAHYDGETHPAVANIGVAPTFQGHQLTEARIEIHLLDKNADLYGKDLSFELVAFLRPETRFDTPEQLKQQIFMDVHQAGLALNLEK